MLNCHQVGRHHRWGLLLTGLVCLVASCSVANRATTSVAMPSAASPRTSLPTPRPAGLPSPTAEAAPSPAPARELPPPPAIAFADRDHGWASRGGTILGTADGGATWRRQYSGGAPVAGIDALSPAVAWAATSRGLLRTTDGGQHWTMLSATPTAFRTVDFVSPTKGWAVVGGADLETVAGPPSPFEAGRLMKTGDGGRTWTLQVWPVSATPADVQSVCLLDATHGWLGSDTAVWQMLPGDSGWYFLWQAPLNPEGRWDARVGCAGPSLVWVLFVNEAGAANHKPYVLYRSTAGGQNWTAIFAEAYTGPSYPTVRPQAPEPGSYPGPFDAVNERVLFLLAWDSSGNGTVNLVRTDDGGRSWQVRPIPPLAGGSPSHLGLSFVDGSHGWVISGPAGQEKIVATTEGGSTWREEYP